MSVEPTPAEKRLRRIARAQPFIVGFVIVLAVAASTALAIISLNARSQSEDLRRAVRDSCFNIEVQRQYHEAIDQLLSTIIRAQDPGPSRAFLRTFRDASRSTADAMILSGCQQEQG